MWLVKTTASAKMTATSENSRKKKECQFIAEALLPLVANQPRANSDFQLARSLQIRPPPSMNVSRTTPGDSPTLNTPPGKRYCHNTAPTNITDAIGVQYFKQVFM